MGLFRSGRKAMRHGDLHDPLGADARVPGTYTVANAGSPTRVGDLTMGDYAQGVPRIRIGSMLSVMRANLPWAILLFLIGFALAGWWSKDFQRNYEGQGRVLAQIASEYIYEPIAGQTSPALTITPDHIVLNEVGIMQSPNVVRDVWASLTNRPDIGVATLEPVASERLRPGQTAIDNPDIYKSFERRFSAVPQAKSSVIDMSFRHPDPDIAVAGLNAFIDSYIQARRDLFVSGTADVVSRRREAAESQLAQNEREIAGFLRRNDISDFDSERQGATTRTEALKAELNALRANITEAETALREVEAQLRATPVEIDLFVDDRASQRIAQAELELQQLLAKYLPTSDPVRQKRVEIAELRSLVTANGGRASGGRRVGPNPVYQNLLERRNELASQADAMREKEVVIQRQLNGADAKTRRLRDLSPGFENLLRERDTLQARLRSLNTREQEALVTQQQAQAASENVRVIFRAEAPVKGRNMRLLMWAVASVVWAAIVALLLLLKTFLDPRLYAPQSVHRLRDGGRRAGDSHTEPPAPIRPQIPEPVPAPPAFAPEPEPVPAPSPFRVASEPAIAPAQVGMGSGGGSSVMAYSAPLSGGSSPVAPAATGPIMFADVPTQLYSGPPQTAGFAGAVATEPTHFAQYSTEVGINPYVGIVDAHRSTHLGSTHLGSTHLGSTYPDADPGRF